MDLVHERPGAVDQLAGITRMSTVRAMVECPAVSANERPQAFSRGSTSPPLQHDFEQPAIHATGFYHRYDAWAGFTTRSPVLGTKERPLNGRPPHTRARQFRASDSGIMSTSVALGASSIRHPSGGANETQHDRSARHLGRSGYSLAVTGPALAGPATTAALRSCTASVSNSHPADDTTTDAKIRTAPSAEVFTVAHYKTVNRAYYRTASSGGRATIAYYVSGATPATGSS